MNILEMLSVVMNAIGIMECVAVVLLSVVVLQEVLYKCSTGLRIAFTIFPIAAVLNVIDYIVLDNNYTISAIVLYIGTILALNWIWNQKTLFHEFEHILIDNAMKSRGFFSVEELKCIVCCVAISALTHIGYNPSMTSSVCTKLTEDRCKHG